MQNKAMWIPYTLHIHKQALCVIETAAVWPQWKQLKKYPYKYTK